MFVLKTTTETSVRKALGDPMPWAPTCGWRTGFYVELVELTCVTHETTFAFHTLRALKIINWCKMGLKPESLGLRDASRFG